MFSEITLSNDDLERVARMAAAYIKQAQQDEDASMEGAAEAAGEQQSAPAPQGFWSTPACLTGAPYEPPAKTTARPTA